MSTCATGTRRGRARTPDTFVGRREELDALRAALEATRAGGAKVTIVEGPAGIGKTSLVQRFVTSTRRTKVIWASGDESERHVDFGLADQLLRRAGMPSVLEAAGHVAVALAILELLGGEDAQAVILVVDDAQWSDLPSLRALLFACRRLVREPVLTILVARDEAGDAVPVGLRRIAENTVQLGPLEPEQVRELASALDVPLSAAAARRLTDHTGGNPLYAGGVLEDLPPHMWRDSRRLPVPRSYAEHISTRLAQTSVMVRQLVEAAAVLGLRSPLSLAARLAALDEPLDVLGEAAAAGLFRPDDDAPEPMVVFAHPLAREAVYRGIPPARRVELHTLAAAVVDDEAATLHHRAHAAIGPDGALADEAECVATREADRGAWREAAAALRVASALSPTRPERERRMLNAINAMLFAGAGASARRSAADTRAFTPGPLLDTVMAYVATYDDAVERAEELFARAWSDTDPAADPRLAATIAAGRAFLARNRLQADATLHWAREAGSLSRDFKIELLATSQRAAGLAMQGRRTEAHQELDAALTQVETTIGANGFPLRSLKGELLLGEDEFAHARAMLLVAAEDSERIGSRVDAAVSLAALAKVEFAVGAWDEVVIAAERAAVLAEESDQVWAKELTRWSLLHVPLARGERVDRANGAEGFGFERVAQVRALACAEVAAADGAPEAVVAALEPLTTQPASLWPWQPQLADALVDLGRLGEASALLRDPGRISGRSTPARLQRTRARIAAATERYDEAVAGFDEAAEVFEQLGMPYEYALTQLEYGRALRRARRRHDAILRLTAARERLEALAARPALERCRRELAACGIEVSTSQAALPGLTPQEQSVAQLVASGLSNDRVAAELVVSTRTIETHLTRIYRKLDVSSRSGLAARLRR